MAPLTRFAFALLLWVPLGWAQVTFTTIDVPGAGITSVQGINAAGDLVGYYGESGNGPYHAFLLRAGNFTPFDYPGANSTRASGINDSGLIVGHTVGVRERGFVYDGNVFTSIRVGNKAATVCLGINNAGDIVGGAGTVFTTRAFKLRAGHFSVINVPGDYVYVYATGVNSFGGVVGWTDSNGFLFKPGKFKTVRFPGSDVTEAWGINDSGVIVGWYGVGASISGFALVDGRFISFAYPGAKGTLAFGVNGSGQVVGSYTFDFITYHGFVTSSITPADFEQARLLPSSPDRIGFRWVAR